MALTKLTTDLIDGSLGTDWQTAIQTSNFTAEAGKGYFVDTTSQVLSVNLPVGVVGMEITIQDYAGTFGTNRVILNANGSEKIQGSTIEGEIITNNATAVLIYQDAIKGWTSQDISLATIDVSWSTPTGQSLTYSTPSPQISIGDAGATFPTTTFTATIAGSIISGTATIAGLPSGITAAQTITGSGAGNTLTVTLTGTFPETDSLNTNLTLSGLTITVPLNVDYLVVAGGGGSSTDSPGGGGAGGLRTSWPGGSGGGQSSESTLLLAASTSYTLTIGSGGGAGSNGSNSIFHTITSTGGGVGSGNGNSYVAGSGGSGGGGSGGRYNNPGGAAVTSPTIQGYRGGNSGSSGGSNYPGAGGGGAAAQGQDSANSSGPGKNGGGGKAVNILNSTNAATSSVGELLPGSLDVYYAGGGGGSVSSGTAGQGGIGGGADGKVFGDGYNNGTANTGGGGAGFSGSGGSGVIILRYPSSYTISGLTQATGSPFTEGTDKVSVFTAGTGNITFS